MTMFPVPGPANGTHFSYHFIFLYKSKNTAILTIISVITHYKE